MGRTQGHSEAFFPARIRGRKYTSECMCMVTLGNIEESSEAEKGISFCLYASGVKPNFGKIDFKRHVKEEIFTNLLIPHWARLVPDCIADPWCSGLG